MNRRILLCKHAAMSSVIKCYAHQPGQSIYFHAYFAAANGHSAAVLLRACPFGNHVLIQSRGIRQKVGEGNDEQHYASSSSGSSQAEDENDPIKFREKFDTELQEFLKNVEEEIKKREKHKIGVERNDGQHYAAASSSTNNDYISSAEENDPNIKFQQMFEVKLKNFLEEQLEKDPKKIFEILFDSSLLRELIDRFVTKFNKENASKGFKIEWKETNQIRQTLMLLFCLFAASMLLPTAYYRYLNMIIPPKVPPPITFNVLMKQPITLDQLIHYIRLGEVKHLFYYPAYDIVVAKLHPGAKIDGRQQFDDPLDGLSVRLDDDIYRQDPLLFPTYIREEEARLGIDPAEALPLTVYPMNTAFFLIVALPLLVLFFAQFYVHRLMIKDAFRVVVSSTGSQMKHEMKAK